MAADRVAVVTGASSGIGKQVAKALVGAGWRVIGTGRDPARIAQAQAEIGAAAAHDPRGGDDQEAGKGSITMLRADLSLIAEARRTAETIAGLTDHVDVLVNNAGGIPSEQVMTMEGLEASFAGNHLGPFVLTNALLPLLRRAAEGRPAGDVRILNTASDASEMIPGINLSDLQNLGNWSTGAAYCTGKLANVLFARALNDRLAKEGIVAHAVHPGAVDSNFFSYGSAEMQERTKGIAKFTEAEGADTLVWLVDADEGREGGRYWFQRQPRAPNALVDDPQVVARFWDESAALVAGR